MSPYELADQHVELLNAITVYTQTYTTILFAFLVAGYLVGPKLDRTMAYILAGLFTAFSFFAFLSMYGAMESVTGLTEVMIADASLDWHAANGPSLGEYATPAFLIMIIGSYLAGLLFFFRARTLQ